MICYRRDTPEACRCLPEITMGWKVSKASSPCIIKV